jgi:thiol:disulfide interchange protein
MKFAKIFALAVLLTLGVAQAHSAGREIYPLPAQAKVDLAAALKTAAQTHQRILIDFGANWCPDCQVLDTYFHDATNRPLIKANFIVVHVNVGVKGINDNLDLAQQYEIPLHKGIPALAVLSDQGKLLYSQKGGEFESMRNLASSDLTKFLIQWKPIR